MTKAQIYDAMKQMLGDDKDLLDDIYKEYLGEAKRLIQDGKNALAQKDTTEMRRAAHTLKGCSANVGAEELRALSYDWQISAQNADFGKYAEDCGKIEEMFNTLLAEEK